MKTKLRARWDVTPQEAVRLQQAWRERVETQDRYGPLQYVAGADMAFDPETNIAFAGVIVYRLPELEEVERRMARRKLRFPYVPGLLSFRESPVLLAAFARLRVSPDVILIDGHGMAHPAALWDCLPPRPASGPAHHRLRQVNPGGRSGGARRPGWFYGPAGRQRRKGGSGAPHA